MGSEIPFLVGMVSVEDGEASITALDYWVVNRRTRVLQIELLCGSAAQVVQIILGRHSSSNEKQCGCF